MKILRNTKLFKATLVCLIGVTSLAHGQTPTQSRIQFSTTGSGTYDVGNVSEFDWQSSASLVIARNLVTASNGATTLDDFFAIAEVGDSATFRIFSEHRLVDMIDSMPSPVPGLDSDGAVNGDAGFEVTSTYDAEVSAVVTSSPLSLPGAPLLLSWTSVSGVYNFNFHDAPDSDPITGGGYANGNVFISGSIGPATSGTYDVNNSQGNLLLSTTISNYDTQYIEADPAAGAPLAGSNYDSLLQIDFGTATPISVGGETGNLPQYTVQAGDLILSSDVSSQFTVNIDEEPNGGQIAPTGTSCEDFSGGTSSTLLSASYEIKNSVIGQNVTPGAFFYFSEFSLVGGSQTIYISQTDSQGNYEFDAKANNVTLYDSNCSKVRDLSISVTGGDATITTGTTLPAGEYFTRVQYDSKSIAGRTAPNPPTVDYDFQTFVDGSLEAQASFLLEKKD